MMGKYFNKPTDNIIRVVVGWGIYSYYGRVIHQPSIYYIDVDGVKIKHSEDFTGKEPIDDFDLAGDYYAKDDFKNVLVVIKIKGLEKPKINRVDKSKYKINVRNIAYKKLLEDLEE